MGGFQACRTGVLLAILFCVSYCMGGDLHPMPTPEEITKAEKALAEVFGKDLEKAKTNQERTKLALEMLRMAAEDKDQANRYVLAKKAKELAVQAMDSKLAISALDVLIEFEAQDMPESPEEAAKRGHALWNESILLQGRARLAKRIDAAEWYLRVLDRISGLDQSIAKARLKELGWGNYVFAFEFEKDNDTEGWTSSPIANVILGNHILDLSVRDGLLTGKIIGGDPYLVRNNLRFEGRYDDVLEIRMAVTKASVGQVFWITQEWPRWTDKQHIDWKIVGDGEMHTYQLPIGKEWNEKIVIGLRIDPGEWDHKLPKSERFAIDYIRLSRSKSLSSASHFSSGQR
ncbi:MAG TPA: hypothetical protein PLQ00_14510 [Thermoguttaceae bacterium]|nr:hypothetical protein [Thermoguttaceae bacterium]